MAIAEAQEPSHTAVHTKAASRVTFANISPARTSHVAKPNVSGPGKSALPTGVSQEGSEYLVTYANDYTPFLTPASYFLIDSNSEGDKGYG